MSFLTKMLGLDKVKEINRAKEEEKNKDAGSPADDNSKMERSP